MLELKVVNAKGETLAQNEGADAVSLVYLKAYEPGDAITLNASTQNVFLHIHFEDSMPPAIVYSPTGALTYPIPPANNRRNHSPKSFIGETHLIRARIASAEELSQTRCLSFNPYDGHEATGYFPHATASVETRGESVFFARNAIDGIFANDSHGDYPYQSWGINRDPAATLTVSFGREIAATEIRLTIRCDFPHDSYWTQATLAFSNGERETISLKKVASPQSFSFKNIKTESVTLKDLIKADDESPFPALTQIEVWGIDSNG